MTTTLGMGQTAAKFWWVLLVRGILLIVLGILMFAWPQATLTVFVFLFVIFLLVDGIMEVAQGFTARREGRSGTALWVQGALAVVVAIVVAIWPRESGVVFVWIIAIWALIAAIAAIAGGIALRKTPGSGWGWILAWGIIAGLFGIALVINPTAGILSLLWIVAIWAIVAGVVMILFSFLVRRVGQSVTVVDAETV